MNGETEVEALSLMAQEASTTPGLMGVFLFLFLFCDTEDRTQGLLQRATQAQPRSGLVLVHCRVRQAQLEPEMLLPQPHGVQRG